MEVFDPHSEVNLHLHLLVDFGVILPHPFEFAFSFIIAQYILQAVHIPFMNELLLFALPAEYKQMCPQA